MSDERIARLQAGYDALAGGDVPSVLALMHPEVVAEDQDRTLEASGPYNGHEGFAAMLATVNEGFDDVRYTPQRFEAAGDQVLVEVRRSGRGSASGLSVDERQFHLFDFDGETVRRFRSFVDEAQARAAYGGG